MKDLFLKYPAGWITVKPWGAEVLWAKTTAYVGKILIVKEGCKLSLQHHNVKEETMLLSKGKIKITYGDSLDELKNVVLTEGLVFHIKPKTIHRVEAIVDSEIIEVSTTELDDLVRHSDEYGRD